MNDEVEKKIQQLLATLEALRQKTQNPAKRYEIVLQKEALEGQSQRNIWKNIQNRGKEYDAIVVALDKAAEDLQKARADLDQLTVALQTVAAAVDLLSKFAPA